MHKSRPSRDAINVLYAWWDTARGERDMPRRSELDLATLRRILPDLVLIGVERGPGRSRHVFTYRLAGTRVDDRLGVYITGKTPQTADLGEAAISVEQQYETVVAERRPLACTHSAVIAGARYVEYERLVVPLAADDGTTVAALLAAIDFTCAYPVARGEPEFCPGPAACDRHDLCLPPMVNGRRLVHPIEPVDDDAKRGSVDAGSRGPTDDASTPRK